MELFSVRARFFNKPFFIYINNDEIVEWAIQIWRTELMKIRVIQNEGEHQVVLEFNVFFRVE